MMRRDGRRMLALALALALAITLLPAAVVHTPATAYAVGDYGRVTANGVKVRKQPSTSANYWFQLDTGFVCQVTDTTVSGGVTWYKVTTNHPDQGNTNTYVGYIHGDFFTRLTAEEAAAWELNPVQVTWTATAAPAVTATASWDGDPTQEEDTGVTLTATPASTATVAASSATVVGVGIVNAGEVNFRETPSGGVIAKLARNTVVDLLSIPAVIDRNNWYYVSYNGYKGYIMAPYITVSSTTTVTAVVPATATPGPVVTAAPAAGGFVKLILSSANLRSSPGGAVKAQWETTGEVRAVAGASVQKSGYTWYPVAESGAVLYVRGDCVEVVSSMDASATATPTPVVTADPSATATPAPTTYGYVRTTLGGTNFRLKPAGQIISQVDKNVVAPCLAAPTVEAGFTWYYVQIGTAKGYLRSDCVVPCNADGSALTATATPAPTAVATPSVTSAFGYVKLTEDKVNLRSTPAGTRIEQLDLGLILPMTGVAVRSGAYDWYPVRTAAGRTGYVRGDCVMECDQDGTATGATATQTPAATTTAGTAVSSYGYVMVTVNKTNLRKTEAGSVIGTLDKGQVWPMTGVMTTKSGYTWYPINAGGSVGYVRGDCAFKLSATQEASYLAGTGVPEESGGSGTTTVTTTYVVTTMDKVNLRASASKDAAAPYNIALGTVMAYNTTKTVGGSLWYRVVYDNTEVWVLGSCVKVMTQAEYETWLGTQPSTTPQPEVITGYVKTTSSGVNVRTTANGSKIIGRVEKGVVMSYAGTPVVERGYSWYLVRSSFGEGYIRGDCVEECAADGSALATPTPAPTTTSTSTTTGQEASYSTLKLGSKGTAVKALVTGLKTQGYYTGSITSTYTTAVQTAVKAFQKAKGLTVDGIAGPATQHALFGTVPVGSTDTSDITMTIYPAEKIDWYTGGIQELWAKGANYKVYDVKTGIVWWAHRWSGGSHVDAEPLTAADTARLCRTYGVSSAQEIADKNLWQRRPLLVTIGTRTFACSLYGVPHNYPDGDTISTNNYKGQLCIHFTNSKTHASNNVDSYHAAAIEYAWQNAPAGHK